MVSGNSGKYSVIEKGVSDSRSTKYEILDVRKIFTIFMNKKDHTFN